MMRIVVSTKVTTRLRMRAAVLWTASFLSFVMTSNAHTAVPAYRPNNAEQIVLKIGDSAMEGALIRLRNQSASAPNDAQAMVRYLNALLAAGVKTGNERYYGFAEQAVTRAPASIRPQVDLIHAQLLQHRHDFSSAAQVLNGILDRDPRNNEALLMRAQTQLHLHAPDSALRDCKALLLRVDLLIATTCIAQARASMSIDLRETERAYALIAAQLESSASASGSMTTRSWSAGVAAELAARSANNEAAFRWYRSAFEWDPHNHFARLSYADFLLAHDRAEEALKIARTGASSADLLRVVLASKNKNSPEAWQLLLGWKEADVRGEKAHLRDRARFELMILNDRPRAHATALENFREQRESEDALLLAMTANATSDARALATIKEWQLERQYADRRLDDLLARLQ